MSPLYIHTGRHAPSAISIPLTSHSSEQLMNRQRQIFPYTLINKSVNGFGYSPSNMFRWNFSVMDSFRAKNYLLNTYFPVEPV